ncbi:MAG TPA: SMC family ATPase [Gemmatimonadaceae bacterium]|nr:SMC family ATPase [Gemmatimonadaceae bacterium]
MRINRLQLTNFRQHADTTIDFGTGITGVIGPNGAGKTTILEAIAWCLYGTGAQRDKLETIRFQRAGERAQVRVVLDFELSGQRYRVNRELSRAEVFVNDDAAPVANTKTGVNEFIQRRLGMTRVEFFNTYFTDQKQLSVMAAMKPTERAHFLSRVLGYEKLRTAQELVRETRKIILAEMSGLRAGMPDAELVARALAEATKRAADTARLATEKRRVHSECDVALQQVLPRWAAAQEARDTLQKIAADMQVAESEVRSFVSRGERIGADLSEIVVAGEELDDIRTRTEPLAALTVELQRLDALYREDGRRQTLAEQAREIALEVERLGSKKQRLAAAPAEEETVTLQLEKQRTALEDVQGRLEARRTEWVRDKQEAQTKLQSLLRHHSEVKEQLKLLADLGPDGACPTCSRALGENFSRVLNHLTEQLEALTSDGKYFRKRMEQLEAMPEDIKALGEARDLAAQEVAGLERQLAKVQSAVQEMSGVAKELALKEQRQAQVTAELAAMPAGFDATEHARVRAQIEELTPMAARGERLAALADREPQIRAEYDEVATLLVAHRARTQELRAAMEGIAFSEEEFVATKAEHERVTESARKAEVERITAEGELRNANAAADAARAAAAELAKREEKLSTLKRARRIHDELDRAYSDLRSDLNAQLRPELSELASGFLSELTDSRYSELELTNEYDLTVLDDGIPKPVISGGEEDIAHLVLRLAISQMIAERAGQPFSLLILDEIFGSLDEARRHNVINLLRRLHDRFEQVILITHIESVREGLDRVISVRYDEGSGSSRVEESAPCDDLANELAGMPVLEPIAAAS